MPPRKKASAAAQKSKPNAKAAKAAAALAAENNVSEAPGEVLAEQPATKGAESKPQVEAPAPAASTALAVFSELPVASRVAGPLNPYSEKPLVPAGWNNHPLGRIEVVASLRNDEFEAQRRAFDRAAVAKRAQAEGVEPAERRKRRPMGAAADVEGFLGPWAGPMDEAKGPAGPSEEEMHVYLAKKDELAVQPAPASAVRIGEEKSVFHGRQERDYMGRSFVHVPQDLDVHLDKEPGSFECFAPKTLIHTWIGHTKGVAAIRFFPRSGHLLLSGSQDCRVKIWNAHGDRQCQRTYMGHNKPVRDICFDPSGARFVSAAYDMCLKHWDTETGQCLRAIQHTAIPFCAKIHPAHPSILLAGCADRRIVQWDLRTGEVVQEYGQHQDAVNSITFFDDNRRFASTSDDKTIRIWDYDIPVTVKYIAEPDMHSMPAAALHPSGSALLFQSLNNQIISYACQEERFQQRGRKFGGHVTSGYSCNIGFSPDGKFLISGDGRGQLVCWNHKTGQIVRRIEAHKKVCIDVQWNPQEPSRVATCSWDGTIKYWD